MIFVSFEYKLKKDVKLLVCVFSTVFSKNFFSATILINVFALNRVSSKFVEKQLINYNCII